MTPSQEKEKTFILLTDLYHSLKRHSLKTLLVMIAFIFLGLAYALNQPVKYRVYGSFKEAKGGIDQLTRGQLMESLLQQVGIPSPSQGCHMIKSWTLLRKVIQELGLQATVKMETPWEERKRVMHENWLAEREIHLPNLDSFTFAHVEYQGETFQKCLLVFLTPTQFEILNSKKEHKGFGNVGKSLTFDQVTLTIEKTPKHLKLHHPYSLLIQPEMAIFDQLKDRLTIRPDVRDATVYELIFRHRDQKLAKKFIDTMMEKYQSHLQEETERISSEQIAYLEKRKQELCLKMDVDFKNHVDYLKTHIGSKGFLNFREHLDHLSNRKQKFLEKRLFVDTEYARLTNQQTSKDVALSGELASLQKEMQKYKKQRDQINLCFSLKKGEHVKQLHPPYTFREELLDRFQDQGLHLAAQEEKILLAEKGHSSAIASLFPAFLTARDQFSKMQRREQNRLIRLQNTDSSSFKELKAVRYKKDQLEKTMQAKADQESEDLLDSIDHEIRVLTLQENLLKERLFSPKKSQESFQGMDLDTIRKLCCDYLHIRDDYTSKIRQLKFSKDHLKDPDFEPISLVQILPDPISQNLAHLVGERIQSMRDTRNLSEKDLERMARQLKKDQDNLKRHIDQTIELTELQKKLIEERIETIQTITLDLLNEEISLLDQQIKDRLKQEKNALQVEKKLLQTQLKEIESELFLVPDQWLKEQQLEFSSDMNMSMLESMVKMVESKNIEHNLIQVQSKPIDLGYSTLIPIPPHLKLFILLGAFIGLLMGFALAIGLDFSKGFPLTLKNLKLQGRKVCGRFKKRQTYHCLSEIGEKNLQILRFLSALIPDRQLGSVIALLSGKGSCYLYPFAKLLAKEGKRVLLLNFDKKTKGPDLFAYLEEKEENCPLKKEEMIDHIPINCDHPFFIELLKRALFRQLLEKKKKQYDVILIQAAHTPADSTSHFFMTISDLISLTIDGESNEILSPYYAWEGQGKTLAFVAN